MNVNRLNAMDPFEPVVAAVARLLEATRALKDATLAKREALVSCRSADILAATRGEEEASEAMALAARGRDEALAGLAVALGLRRAPDSLRAVAELAGEPSRTRLKTLRIELRDLAGELGEMNQLNRELAEQSLGHLRSLFQLFAGEPARRAVYARPAEAAAFKPRSGVIVDRVA